MAGTTHRHPTVRSLKLGGCQHPRSRPRAPHLSAELQRHNALYYSGGATELSDPDFDALLRELQDLEDAHPELQTPDSPTRRVGGAPIEHFVTVEHAVPMLSIDNTYNQDELRTWYDRTAKALGFFKEPKDNPAGLFADKKPKAAPPDLGPPLRTEPKVDGVALSLTYENGELIRAVTRGDGRKGDDITHNIRTVVGVPVRLTGDAIPSLLEVRGEIFMPDAVFAALNARRRAADEEPYANPRNCTAGTLKQKTPSKVHGGLRFYAHNLGVWEPGTPTGPPPPPRRPASSPPPTPWACPPTPTPPTPPPLMTPGPRSKPSTKSATSSTTPPTAWSSSSTTSPPTSSWGPTASPPAGASPSSTPPSASPPCSKKSSGKWAKPASSPPAPG